MGASPDASAYPPWRAHPEGTTWIPERPAVFVGVPVLHFFSVQLKDVTDSETLVLAPALLPFSM